jgi:hypothetical protein
MGWKPERIFPISESAESASLQPPPTAMDGIPRQEESFTPLESSMPEYRDNIHLSHDNSAAHAHAMTTPNTEDETTISTMTTATILPSEMPPVTVAAEYVHVLDGENCNANDDDDDDETGTDGYFTKNTQQVIID